MHNRSTLLSRASHCFMHHHITDARGTKTEYGIKNRLVTSKYLCTAPKMRQLSSYDISSFPCINVLNSNEHIAETT